LLEEEIRIDIIITAAALEKLKEIVSKEKHSPRIDANIAGGCGISVKFELLFDEPRRNDTVVEYEDIQIQVDPFTKRYLGEATQIDYSVEEGFLVGENFISGDCAI
jgi:Fe-S cluster assembly iron-binding protein IscA